MSNKWFRWTQRLAASGAVGVLESPAESGQTTVGPGGFAETEPSAWLLPALDRLDAHGLAQRVEPAQLVIFNQLVQEHSSSGNPAPPDVDWQAMLDAPWYPVDWTTARTEPLPMLAQREPTHDHWFCSDPPAISRYGHRGCPDTVVA